MGFPFIEHQDDRDLIQRIQYAQNHCHLKNDNFSLEKQNIDDKGKLGKSGCFGSKIMKIGRLFEFDKAQDEFCSV
jgi:hypothetical protein